MSENTIETTTVKTETESVVNLDCKGILMLLEKQSDRMNTLEGKFDKLLLSIDGKMEKLIDVLISRQDFPVRIFAWVLGIVIIAVLGSILGHEVLLDYFKAARS
jgi:hypothetical protein